MWHGISKFYINIVFIVYSELETQIKDIVSRVGSGQGLPWPKSMALKSIVSQERSRVALLRLLELRLGIRHQTNLLLSANGEIIPVVSASYCILLFVTNCSLFVDITMHLLS